MVAALLIKPNKLFADDVREILTANFDRVSVYCGQVGDPLPAGLLDDKPDVLISYLAPWVVPEQVLNDTKKWNINFHPGPPEYAGIGCTNFAIYNGEKQYGVTCHHMAARVDTGKIIEVARFAILPDDTVFALTNRAYEHLFALFQKIIPLVASGGPLPESEERWNENINTRSQLEELCVIRPDMTEEEVARRIRATTYPNMPGAYVELYGRRFEHNPHR